ncbi:MAG: response regulator [Planctomycetota bacterium]
MPAISFTPPRVLITEDNPGLAMVMLVTFQHAGFSPLVFHDGLEAWEAFAEAPFDLVISDYEMPGIDGLEFCRRIRNQGHGIPFVLVSGRQTELTQSDIASDLQIDMVLAKPFSPRSVAGIGRRLVDQHSQLCMA